MRALLPARQPIAPYYRTVRGNRADGLAHPCGVLCGIKSGILIADHVPRMVGDRRTGWAFSIGYIKALHEMALDARRA